MRANNRQKINELPGNYFFLARFSKFGRLMEHLNLLNGPC